MPASDSFLLTVAETRRADAAAIAAGTSGLALMRRAGAAVARRAAALAGEGARVLVLCGPGNNGGDGLVAAALLADRGFAVTVALLGPRAALRGDAAEAAAGWPGPVADPGRIDPAACDLVIDALFGAGLSRSLDGAALDLVRRVAASGRPVLAVDVPSGLDGDTGAIRGEAARARETVTFARRKPGHLLLPGRALCGDVHVADIGLDDALIAGLGPKTFANEPALWRPAFPEPDETGHKYARGHALVLSGPATRTGAARLAARAALRIGAGLVTLAAPPDALAECAAHVTAIMLRRLADADALGALLEDRRYNAVVAGPGLGEEAEALTRAALAAGRASVLDADALTAFADRAGALGDLVRRSGAPTVLTPHSGEFDRLFAGEAGVLDPASKVERARRAAARVGAVVVLKGADTVVAGPDGRAAINAHATPYLGTAGSGDVLAGMIGGLLAQGMATFEAACAGVWLHGDAGRAHGPGLIAEDLPELLPGALRRRLSQVPDRP